MQEPTDAEGRRRFHGAFTGGFSAGYFNTVGSAEGWAPSSFRSSRADFPPPTTATTTDAVALSPPQQQKQQKQSIEQFLDEDELEEYRKTKLQTNATYDTFGATAAEKAKQVALEASRQRPSFLPGLLLVPEEAIAPVTESMGVRLLQHMGWRQGKGIGEGGRRGMDMDGMPSEQTKKNKRKRKRMWGAVVGVGPDNTPLYLLNPKNDVFGLGYDPYKNAEEFRKAKKSGIGRVGGSSRTSRGVAFGTGVLEEDDSFDILEDYVTHDDGGGLLLEGELNEEGGVDARGFPLRRDGVSSIKKSAPGLGDRLALQGYAFEVQEEEVEESDDGGGRGGRGTKGHRPLQLTAGGPAVAGLLTSKDHVMDAYRKEKERKRRELIPGFVMAEHDGDGREGGMLKLNFYPPPVIPDDFIPVHRIVPEKEEVVGVGVSQTQKAAVPPPPPPQDAQLRQEIDRMAFFVAKNGIFVEKVARRQQEQEHASAGKGVFSFLLGGGEGADYYRWKVSHLRTLLHGPGSKQQHQAQKQSMNMVMNTIGRRTAPLSADDRGSMLGEKQLPQHKTNTSTATATTTTATKEQQPVAGLARSLLQVAEADRQRLAAAMGSTFVRASTDDTSTMEQHTSGGVRPGFVPSSKKESASLPLPVIGPAPSSKPMPRGIVTIDDLSRPLDSNTTSLEQNNHHGRSNAQQQLPVRRTDEWRPDPLLCRRLDVPDPFKGRPKESQGSKFRTDQFTLPATVEAMAKVATAAAPGAAAFLIPPSVKVAAEEAAAAAQLATSDIVHPRGTQGVVEEEGEKEKVGVDNDNNNDIDNDVDGEAAAQAFLQSMFGTGTVEEEQGGEVSVQTTKQPAVGMSAIAKPMNVFKAIFEDETSEEEEEEEEEEEDEERQKQQEGEREKEAFGFEKFKKAPGERIYAVSQSLRDQLESMPPEERRRVEAALKVVTESKKRKNEHDSRKKHHKSKKRKSKKKHKKEKRKEEKEKKNKRPRSGSEGEEESTTDTSSM